jgi:biopolymer transport protein ExbD/biopolymer transport protein TolR
MAGAVGVGKSPRSDINITPLVDVVLVLLIIFMVLTPLMEKEMAIRVPDQPDPTQPVPPPDPNEPPPVVFHVDADGKFTVNGNVISDEKGSEELHNYYAREKNRGEANPIIFFDADDKAKYVRCVKALDLIKDSSPGWTIGMMTEKPPEPPPGVPAVPGAPGAPGAPGEPAAPGAPTPPAPPK